MKLVTSFNIESTRGIVACYRLELEDTPLDVGISLDSSYFDKKRPVPVYIPVSGFIVTSDLNIPGQLIKPIEVTPSGSPKSLHTVHGQYIVPGHYLIILVDTDTGYIDYSIGILKPEMGPNLKVAAQVMWCMGNSTESRTKLLMKGLTKTFIELDPSRVSHLYGTANPKLIAESVIRDGSKEIQDRIKKESEKPSYILPDLLLELTRAKSEILLDGEAGRDIPVIENTNDEYDIFYNSWYSIVGAGPSYLEPGVLEIRYLVRVISNSGNGRKFNNLPKSLKIVDKLGNRLYDRLTVRVNDQILLEKLSNLGLVVGNAVYNDQVVLDISTIPLVNNHYYTLSKTSDYFNMAKFFRTILDIFDYESSLAVVLEISKNPERIVKNHLTVDNVEYSISDYFIGKNTVSEFKKSLLRDFVVYGLFEDYSKKLSEAGLKIESTNLSEYDKFLVELWKYCSESCKVKRYSYFRLKRDMAKFYYTSVHITGHPLGLLLDDPFIRNSCNLEQKSKPFPREVSFTRVIVGISSKSPTLIIRSIIDESTTVSVAKDYKNILTLEDGSKSN